MVSNLLRPGLLHTMMALLLVQINQLWIPLLQLTKILLSDVIYLIFLYSDDLLLKTIAVGASLAVLPVDSRDSDSYWEIG